MEFKEGEGELIGDLNLIYCEAEKESLCLIEQVRLEAAIKVAGAGADLITFSHRVELPELLP
ncbi:MAG: hypothetical protein GTN62_01090 [Gemmatimonadales bacterium]|nr:hypothetical protein [Gemmatimonadales bacterium]NIP06163.1 hypothetical protein [Gemmatimonadales bacterium]